MIAFGKSGIGYIDAGLSYIPVDSDIQVNGMPTPYEIKDDLGWYFAVGVAVGERWQTFAEAQYRTFVWEIDAEGLPPGLPQPEMR